MQEAAQVRHGDVDVVTVHGEGWTTSEGLHQIYLNNAATSFPKAPGVVEAVVASLSSPPHEAARSTSADAVDVEAGTRAALATMLQVPPPRVVLTSGATHGANLAIWGRALLGPLHAITTAFEHNSVLRPLRHAADRTGGSVRVLSTRDGAPDLDELERMVADQPANLVAVTHASNVTGRVIDVTALFDVAHRIGAVTLLDASQSIGWVPVHPAAIGADIVVLTGHKGLLGPTGTGALVVAEGVELAQLIVGGTGTRSDLVHHPIDWPVAMEAGTPNLPGLAGLRAALEWRAGSSPEALEKGAQQADRLRVGLRQLSGVSILDDVEVLRTPIVSCSVEGWEVEELGYLLEESFGITSRTGLHCAPLVHRDLDLPGGTLRFSPGPFTSDDDVDCVLGAMEKVTACTS